MLQIIARTYATADEDRARLERSLDVSSREMYERTQEIKHQAFHDKLTGLPNRAHFLDRVKFAVSKSARSKVNLAVLFIDLDNFKMINDSLGHEAGDQMLVEVSKRILECIRPGDSVARLGGDEFTVLLEDAIDPENAKVIAKRILANMKEPMYLGQTETYATASIGICFSPADQMSAEEMIKSADMAMYDAKTKGRARCVTFKESMRAQAADRMKLETELRLALDRKEFRLVYQPLVSMETGKTLGAEALIRWEHPVRGNIPPNYFIPIAEEIGVIVPIGNWVLNEACRQMKAWHDESGTSDLLMSVNLSGRQLQRRDVVDKVSEALEHSQLKPSCLQLEITETVLLADHKEVALKLDGLKELGVHIALDDFGTGYSSLSILSDFPIDSIKIDRSFITKLKNDQKAQAVVEAIMALSKSLKMDVTSEGIESDFEFDYVRNLGCAIGQGYLFSRPVESDSFLQAAADIDSGANQAA